MSSTNHYREQIQRATHRLAQLQARELLAHQRQDAREKAIKRRDDAKRRRQVAELVFLVGAQNLPDNEIVAALQRHLLTVNETRPSPSH
ncbi:hypothetical protein [uncultured Stenotrophomonas sp.]|uniref:hypothetical protein n=1 Tax=uncultured Stenotrophomonas sp. TaxID=165438 RepID=UPI0025DC6B80|nr:hypothetical protein [uncultured Stenotrophomonas sp.]